MSNGYDDARQTQANIRAANTIIRSAVADSDRNSILMDLLINAAEAGGAPPPDPDPPPPDPDPDPPPPNIPGGMTEGHWLFGETQSDTQLESYGIPNARLAVTLGRARRPGHVDCLVWHPWYHPKHTTNPDQINRFAAAGPAAWERWVIDELVEGAVQYQAPYAGVDWEGLLTRPALLPTIELLSERLRARGIRVMHWPKTSFEHQIRHMGRSVAWWSAWAREHLDAIGWWNPSASASGYERGADEVEDFGFSGEQYGICYPLKGVPHSEDVRIVNRPWGGIFNPKSHYDIVPVARNVW